MMINKIVSKKDIVIPKGTVFENIDGSTSHHYYGCYNTNIGLDNDTCARIIVTDENKEYFRKEE